MAKDITSGNPLVDACMLKFIEDDVLGWALVTYFEKKGLLNREEFIDTLNEEFAWITEAKRLASQEDKSNS